MEHTPYKKVGQPTSFKGIKGPYLFLALYLTAGLLFAALLIFVLPFDKLFQILIILVLVIVWYIKILEFKKKCKKGDINIINKNRCRKHLLIKGSSLNEFKKN